MFRTLRSRDDQTSPSYGSCPNDVYIVRPHGSIERIVITDDFLAEDALYVAFHYRVLLA